jgi:hypothetical protein
LFILFIRSKSPLQRSEFNVDVFSPAAATRRGGTGPAIKVPDRDHRESFCRVAAMSGNRRLYHLIEKPPRGPCRLKPPPP